MHDGMNTEQTWTCHHFPHSCILPVVHVAYTCDILAAPRFKAKAHIFVPACKSFCFQPFPSLSSVSLSHVVAQTIYQDIFHFLCVHVFLLFSIEDTHQSMIDSRAKSYLKKIYIHIYKLYCIIKNMES